MGRSDIIKKLIMDGYKVIQRWDKESNYYELITDIHSVSGQRFSLHRRFLHSELQFTKFDLIAYEEERCLNALYSEILKAAE